MGLNKNNGDNKIKSIEKRPSMKVYMLKNY